MKRKQKNKKYDEKFLLEIWKEVGSTTEIFSEVLSSMEAYQVAGTQKLKRSKILPANGKFECIGCGKCCGNQRIVEITPHDIRKWLNNGSGITLMSICVTRTSPIYMGVPPIFGMDIKENYLKKQEYRSDLYHSVMEERNPSLKDIGDDEISQCVFYNNIERKCSLDVLTRPDSCITFPYSYNREKDGTSKMILQGSRICRGIFTKGGMVTEPDETAYRTFGWRIGSNQFMKNKCKGRGNMISLLEYIGTIIYFLHDEYSNMLVLQDSINEEELNSEKQRQ
jgi:Fe-S-cluster containining protein